MLEKINLKGQALVEYILIVFFVSVASMEILKLVNIMLSAAFLDSVYSIAYNIK